jgi:homoserine O-acetyltransferase
MKESTVGIVKPKRFTFARPGEEMPLDSGRKLGPITLEYETYGELNEEKSNGVIVFHALSGDAHVAGYHRHSDEKPGWWDNAIGPGKAVDTDRYFVVCANVIGGCRGSTGPGSVDPITRGPYGSRFPIITIRDMVRAQVSLLDHLEIERVLAAIGGSMGGFQVLQFATSYPDRCSLAIPVATAGRQSAQNIAFNEIGRQAIMSDPKWSNGDYYGGEPPVDGLSIARMVGHVTYLSDETLRRRFGRRAKEGAQLNGSLSKDPCFEVESYLRYKGNAFTKRFDANSYLYISRAIDLFDLSPGGPSLAPAFRSCRTRFLVLSFSSDWLYPPAQSEEVVDAIRSNGLYARYQQIQSSYGHDAFLLEADKIEDLVRWFLIAEAGKKYYEADGNYPIS